MDKKSSNTGISKSLLRSLNRSYISEPIKDTNKIDELMSKFYGGELDTIKSVLESNEILNFKNSTGQTLIHAILRNESPNVNEEDKLLVIRMLNDKNVSINSMDQLNQNPLHLACQKGYVSIIIYLLSNGCDQKLNDNNGNAPVHYLIDKFIDNCKQDDLYKPSNQEIKSINSGQIKKINDIINNQNLSIFVKLFETESITDLADTNKYTLFPAAQQIINALDLFIKHSTQNLLPKIYALIDNKISEINKIFVDKIDSDENKFMKAKNIILGTKNEITKLYKFNLDDNTIIWEDFIQNQKLKIITNKTSYIEKINLSKKNILDQLANVIQRKKLVDLKKNYYIPFVQFTFSVYFIFEYIKNNGVQSRLTPDPKSIPKQELNPSALAYKINDDGIDLLDKQTLEQIQEFHYGNLIANPDNGILTLLNGTDNYYGISKLNLSTVPYLFNHLANVIDSNGDELFGDILLVSNKDVSDNITGITDVSGNIIGIPNVTIFSHSNFDINEGDSIDGLYYLNRPINLHENEDYGIYYLSGFYKVQLFNNSNNSNNRNNVWIYGTYLPNIQNQKQPNFNGFEDINFPLFIFEKLQEQRNNQLMDELIGSSNNNSKDDKSKDDKTKYDNLKKFIENTLDGNTVDEQKKIIAKSYKFTYESLDQIILGHKKLSLDFFTDSIIPNEHIIIAIVNNDLDFLVDLVVDLKEFITIELTRFVSFQFRNNIKICFDKDFDAFGFKPQEIIQYIASQNPIIKLIVNNNNLMTRLQNVIKYTQANTFLANIKNLLDNRNFIDNIGTTNEKVMIFLNFMSGIDFNRAELSNIVRDLVNYVNSHPIAGIVGSLIPMLPNGIIIPANTGLVIGPGPGPGPIVLPANFSPNPAQVTDCILLAINIINYYNTTLLPPNQMIFPTSTVGLAGFQAFIPNVSKKIKNKDYIKHFSEIIPEYFQFLICKKIFNNIGNNLPNNSQSYEKIFFPPLGIGSILNTLDYYNSLGEPDSFLDINRPSNFKKNDIFRESSILITRPIINYIGDPNNQFVQKLNTIVNKLTPTPQNPTEVIKLSRELLEETINIIILLGNSNEQDEFKKFLGKSVLQTIINIDNDNIDINNPTNIILGTEVETSSAIISFSNDLNLIKKSLIMAYLPDPKIIRNENLFINPPEKIEKKINEYYLWHHEKKHKYFKLYPINNLINIINNDIDLIVRSFEFLKNEDELRNELIKIDLFNIKYFTNIMIRTINNLVILEKYINDVNIEIFEKLSDEFDKIFDNLINNNKNPLNQDTINILNKLNEYKNYSKNNYDNSKEKFINSNFKKDLSDIYNDILKILGMFDELVEKINEYQSEYQLEKYNEFIGEYIKNITSTTLSLPKPIELTNTLFNNFTFGIRKNFPDTFEKYKELYFNLKPELSNIYDLDVLNLLNSKYTNKNILDPKQILINKNYKNDFVSKIYPYTNCQNYNEFYLNSDPIDKIKFDQNYKIKLMFNEYINNIDDEKSYCTYYDDIDTNKITEKNTFAIGFNIPNDNEDCTFEPKKYNDTLVDINYIKNYSSVTISSSNTKINSGPKNIATYHFKPTLNISQIDFSTYILTNNLGELVNLIVHLIYKSFVSKTDLLNLFFEKEKRHSITLYNTSIFDPTLPSSTSTSTSTPTSTSTLPTIKKDFDLGINLENYGINEKYEKNIFNTLAFLNSDSKEQMNYLLGNIKIFVKIILGTQINKEIGAILEQIKIKYTDSNKQKIIENNSNQIKIFNEKISKIKLKSNQLDLMVEEIMKSSSSSSPSSSPSSILEYNQLARLVKTNYTDKKSKKILKDKCLNTKKTDDLLGIGFDYRVLDLNGNTIINRLVDQFNLYGIEKIITSKPFLATYKNNNNQTPLDYLFNQIFNIQNDYDDTNFEQRIKKYSLALTNLIESNDSFKNISFENSENIVKNIISNSIYLFNEIMWLKLYEYPTGWEYLDKKNLKSTLGNIKEKLLILSFDRQCDMRILIKNEKKQQEEKLNIYITQLQNNISNYENKIYQYESNKSDESDSDLTNLISGTDVSGNIIDKYKELAKTNKKTIEEYKNYMYNLGTNIEKNIETKINNIYEEYNEKELIKFTNIDWDKYENMVNKFDSDYLKIIEILNSKIKNINTISSFLIKIIKFDISNIKINGENNLENNIKVINKYFDKIFDNMFADYWDLDKYEDSDYNILNKSILGILNINVVGIISNELFNTFINYIIQKNIYFDKIKNKFDEIKKNTNTNTHTIINSIKLYLHNSVISKLNKRNPDKTTYTDLEIQKKIILNELNYLVGEELDSDDINELGKIIEFNKFLCENISYNCHEEIIKILYDCKKISLYYKIYNQLKKNN